jgi:hypothetical protein
MGTKGSTVAAPVWTFGGLNVSFSQIIGYRVVPAHVELHNLDGSRTIVDDPAAVKDCARKDNKLRTYLATPEAREIATHANRNLAMAPPMVRSAGGTD